MPEHLKKFCLIIKCHGIYKVEHFFEGIHWSVDNLSKIDVDEDAHEDLAIKTIGETTMAWDGISKVFDSESTLETRGEKATKGGDEGGKTGYD